MSALVVAALSLLAQGPADSLSSEATLYLEASEEGLQAEESWAVRNLGTAPVPASALVVELPPDILQIRAEGDASTGFEVAKDNRSLRGTTPLPPGETRVVTVRYALRSTESEISLSRVAPFSVGRWRVILEDQPALSLASSEKVTKTQREINGVKFALWEATEIAPGRRVEITLSGLPVRSMAPQGVAVGVVLLILAWAVRSLLRGRAPAATAARAKAVKDAPVAPLSGVARRERLVRAVELLDEDHAKGKLDADQHARRRRALVGELAVVLRQIELESSAHAHGA